MNMTNAFPIFICQIIVRILENVVKMWLI